MVPKIPFWMRQRQIKVEAVDAATVALKAPNLPPHELKLVPADDAKSLKAALYDVLPDGGKSLITEAPTGFGEPTAAWQYAFELYRQRVII